MAGRLFTLVCALALATPVASSAAEGSLYDGPGPRPGPDILYAKPKPAPQLRNAGIWRARPILVSGASAYRRGEFLYQDFLYDDTGAKGEPDSEDPRASATFARFNGTYRYPTDDASYAQNLADLVELRLKPLRRATAFRITFNSMTDPGLVAATIALGDSAGPRPFPHGAGVQAPAELFLTVHGDEAELIDAGDGAVLAVEPTAAVSTRRRQIEVRVPHAAWKPGAEERIAAGTGLWDADADAYLRPQAAADATTPGGAAGGDPAALINVAFRFDEPWPDVADVPSIFADPKWWRDDAQAQALAEGDISRFATVVDFRKLRRGERDDMRGDPGGVPASGPMNRILSSRFSFGQGADWGIGCEGTDDCSSQLLGRLLPYSVYVPEGPEPNRGYGLTLLLHSLGAGYNQFSASRNQSQLGERDPGSIVITPSGRGTDGWYYGAAGADAFEVWADVARRYRLDPGLTAISGYSMGGYGTYKLAAAYPDLFAAAQPVVGPPGQGVWVPPADPTGGAASNTNRMLASVRHVPFLIFNGVLDELVPYASAAAQADEFERLTYRFAFWSFPTADHFALAANDQYSEAAEFLGDRRVVRNPAHVSYVVNPTMDFPERGTIADHAYWLSGMRLRDPGGEAPLGTVDAVSEGFGRGDPPAGEARASTGTIEPGNFGAPLPYEERRIDWGEAPGAPRADRLQLEADNLARVVVHAKRARLSCDPELDVETDGPLTVRLAGCRGKKLRFG